MNKIPEVGGRHLWFNLSGELNHSSGNIPLEISKPYAFKNLLCKQPAAKKLDMSKNFKYGVPVDRYVFSCLLLNISDSLYMSRFPSKLN